MEEEETDARWVPRNRRWSVSWGSELYGLALWGVGCDGGGGVGLPGSAAVVGLAGWGLGLAGWAGWAGWAGSAVVVGLAGWTFGLAGWAG